MVNLIGKFDRKNGYEQVRVNTTIYNGKAYVDVRVYISLKGEWQATKKGITVNDSDAHTLAKLIRKAAQSIATEKLQNATAV